MIRIEKLEMESLGKFSDESKTFICKRGDRWDDMGNSFVGCIATRTGKILEYANSGLIVAKKVVVLYLFKKRV